MPIVGSVLGALKRKKVRLQLSISMLFMILILPVLALIMFYSYRENSRNLISLANVQIERARDDSIAVATNLVEPVSGTLRMIAEIAASNPAYFRTEQSRDLLYQAAKRTRTFAIADPSVNPDTRSPVISVGYPIIVDNKVIGVACANITFDILARYLATQKTSSNSTAFIMDHFGK